MNNNTIKINNKKIGKEQPVFIIAEASANHSQDFSKAVKLIKAAKKAGADAIKFQTYTPDTMTLDIDNKYFRIKHPKWGGQTLYQLYKKAYTPWSWFKKLKKIADDLGIIFISTVFDRKAVDLLEEIDVPMHKIASFELVDLALIEYAAKSGKPLIMSTGMAKLKEIKEAVYTAQKAGSKKIILLKCVSSYPAKAEDMNLKTIPHLAKTFNCPVGLSDHTLNNNIATTAVALGACVIEKHFTLSKRINSPDNFFSIEFQDLKQLIEDIRITEESMGRVCYGVDREQATSYVHRRSLFAVEDIKKGEIFCEKNVRSIRPAYGLPPRYLNHLLGQIARRDIRRGTPLTKTLLKS